MKHILVVTWTVIRVAVAVLCVVWVSLRLRAFDPVLGLTLPQWLVPFAGLARYTPYFVGALIAVYITFEAPLSGMSTNPARTFGPAFHAGYWHAMWIYFLAPTLGMLAAADVFLRVRGGTPPYCAKLHHDNDKRCIFHHE